MDIPGVQPMDDRLTAKGQWKIDKLDGRVEGGWMS